MGWFASTSVWVWEQAFSWPKIWRGLAIYGTFLVLVMVYGSIRLSFFHPQPGTVRVHQIIEADDWPNDRMVAELASNDPAYQQRTITIVFTMSPGGG